MTNISTKNVIWLSVSSANSNNFAPLQHAMTKQHVTSSRLYILPQLLYGSLDDGEPYTDFRENLQQH